MSRIGWSGDGGGAVGWGGGCVGQFFCSSVQAYGCRGDEVPEMGYWEYRVGDYSTWLRSRVRDSGYWSKIRSCGYGGVVGLAWQWWWHVLRFWGFCFDSQA